ncbi:hypothetical protein BJY04DRAFT_220723 [Aspergillus karnatakaensis]|uniref:uncharacterized protein n=1 Tax=Aspergillus karnatakaensis TaxID=1810916 RepID=UPI003CCCC805
MSSNFLFVDFEDAKSQRLALSKKKHAFLQTKHHQRRRNESLQRLKTSISPFPTKSTPQPLVKNAKQPCDHDESDNVPPSCALRTLLSPVAIDPFSSLGSSMTNEMEPYFYYYKDYFAPSIYPFGAEEMSTWWWQTSAGKPALLQAVLSASAYHRSCIGHLSSTPSPLGPQSAMDSLQLRTRAIRGLQRVLDNLDETFLDLAILIVANLICVEAASAQIDAVCAHISGLRRLIYLRGGLDNLGDLTISTIYCGDFMRGLLLGSSPAFPMSNAWKNRVFEKSKAAKLDPGSLGPSSPGSKFFASPWSKELHLGLKSTLRLFQRLTSYYNSTTLGLSSGAPFDSSLIIMGGHQLLSMPFAVSSNNFDEPLRLALVVYCANRIFDLQPTHCVLFAVEDLQRSLQAPLAILQETADDLLFWILFIGCLASQGRECHQWFAIRLGEAAIRLAVTDWDDALQLLSQFFFTLRPSESQPRRLWKEVLPQSL